MSMSNETGAKRCPRVREFGPADGFDPLGVFRGIRGSGREAFYFETASALGAPPERTVIGVGPFAILRESGGRAELTEHGQTRLLEASFMDELGRRVSQLPAAGSAAGCAPG